MLARLISGGQTGVDRGALDAALRRGFPCGGSCPRGRRAEDGPIPARYPLTELETASYIARTRRNVAESDGTLILAPGALSGGTRATKNHADKTGKACLVIDTNDPDTGAQARGVRHWLEREDIRVLNVAGPRESSCPGISAIAELFVGRILGGLSPS